ncbi:putative Similar uroporphyrinogen-III methyltransferase/uroporphyrinogen-III synthase [Paenibacillus dendritiformis C454]|uniref:Uroporphyrinogen-III C-methyltransferase n=1 Tax=Paenibacillus dendritiformis C454 TaxID=1131935 RepID=H3SCT2_9BACL|nr:uroporphyrinogen-III C-methyltransferase [Paenibacillus dendritiformis]EHQ63185.1 putative Similar uroporphyrinogen-III methyltransferase/uroporphyrinogen-III synthase [Paenibacillus dendritiformis C454]
MSGKVVLVGAGPGEAGLLTVKALEFIRQADVIVYDRLVNPALLKDRKPDCELIYVGKEPSHHPIPQAEIEQILVNQAKRNKLVIRLKSGDPYVFGRGGEEGETLYAAGIPFEVVPGVTSAIGGLAYAGIPVTHRDCASSFHVITGHLKEGSDPLDWTSLARLDGTLIFLMGMTQLPSICANLIQHGRRPDTAAAVVEWASRSRQRTVTGDLTTICAKVAEANIGAPGLIVVGDVVKLRDKLKFFEKAPMFRKHILLPRARAGRSELAARITALGGEVTLYPGIRIEKLPDPAQMNAVLASLPEYEEILFTSAEAVSLFIEAMLESGKDNRALSGIRLTAIGKLTKEKLREYGLAADVLVSRRSADLIRQACAGNWRQGTKVLLAGSEKHAAQLADELVGAAEFAALPLYREVLETERPFDLSKFDAVCFSSSASVEHLLSVLSAEEQALLRSMKLLSIGPMTSRTIREQGLEVYREAETAQPDSLIALLLEESGEVMPT